MQYLDDSGRQAGELEQLLDDGPPYNQHTTVYAVTGPVPTSLDDAAKTPVAWRTDDGWVVDQPRLIRLRANHQAHQAWRALDEEEQLAVRLGRAEQGEVGIRDIDAAARIVDPVGWKRPMATVLMRGRVRPDGEGRWVADHGHGSTTVTVGTYDTPDQARQAVEEAIQRARAGAAAQLPDELAAMADTRRWPQPHIDVWATTSQEIRADRKARTDTTRSREE